MNSTMKADISASKNFGDVIALASRKPAHVTAAVAAPSRVSVNGPELWALGYRRLVPIVPPSATISEKSSMAKRKDARGKAVGVKGRDGRWYGFDWLPYESNEDDVARWVAMGAGCGVKTGEGLVLIDADTLDEEHASIIARTIEKHFGRLPARVGRHPKVGYPMRVSEPLRYTRIEFGALLENNTLASRVEVLSDGQQFVAAGVHPLTNQPYTWTRPLVPFDDLPCFPAASVLHMLEELRTLLPAATKLTHAGAGTAVDQASLRGDPAMIRKAVEATPNTSEAFSTRESYLAFGYALKAALPDDETEAFDIFSAWCERWKDGTNDPDIVEADWRRMKAPFRRGASWLYELAEQHAPQAFSRTEVFFQPIEDSESSDGDGAGTFTIEPTHYTFPDPASIKPRQWIYGDHYIRGFLSATVAPGGLGKSSLSIAEALAMASGKPLLGIEPKGQFHVWLWNGEDPRDELERRIAATLQHYGLTAADIGDRLFVDSGMEQEIVLAKEARNGALIVEPVAGALVAAINRREIDVFMVDPFVSSHKVSENDNGSIDLVVKRWSKIAFVTGTSIELVHHVRKTKGAEVTVEDARGASALVNATRVTRALTRMTENEGRALGVADPWRYFRSGGVAKNNLAPAAGASADKAEWFTLKSEQLGNGTGEGVAAFMSGDAVGVVTCAAPASMAQSHDPDEANEALRLIAEGVWRSDVRAGDAWVGHAVAQAFGLDASDNSDKTKINGILKQWRRERAITDVSRMDKSRHNRQFVLVNSRPAPPEPAAQADSVFA